MLDGPRRLRAFPSEVRMEGRMTDYDPHMPDWDDEAATSVFDIPPSPPARKPPVSTFDDVPRLVSAPAIELRRPAIELRRSGSSQVSMRLDDAPIRLVTDSPFGGSIEFLAPIALPSLEQTAPSPSPARKRALDIRTKLIVAATILLVVGGIGWTVAS